MHYLYLLHPHYIIHYRPMVFILSSLFLDFHLLTVFEVYDLSLISILVRGCSNLGLDYLLRRNCWIVHQLDHRNSLLVFGLCFLFRIICFVRFLLPLLINNYWLFEPRGNFIFGHESACSRIYIIIFTFLFNISIVLWLHSVSLLVHFCEAIKLFLISW